MLSQMKTIIKLFSYILCYSSFVLVTALSMGHKALSSSRTQCGYSPHISQKLSVQTILEFFEFKIVHINTEESS